MRQAAFQKLVLDYYRQQGRDLPWRQPAADGSFDPYKILVSEVMLQQTQVPRVMPKYAEFLQRFPTLTCLAKALLSEVLKVWSGLGYNRRAKYLHQAAKQLVSQPRPWSYEQLVALPGIGPNTAAAICVYAFNQPHIFVETNIRTVFIHHFLAHQQRVSDAEIAKLVAKTLPTPDYRTWYWALMDYGAHLKATTGTHLTQSRQFVKQSQFMGSQRQLRGQVIRELTKRQANFRQLQQLSSDERLAQVLRQLVQEGLVEEQGRKYRLAA